MSRRDLSPKFYDLTHDAQSKRRLQLAVLVGVRDSFRADSLHFDADLVDDCIQRLEVEIGYQADGLSRPVFFPQRSPLL